MRRSTGAKALVDIHASPEVDRLLDEFADKLRPIDSTEMVLRMNDKAGKTRGQDLDPKELASPTGWSRRCTSP
jgi:hypothetical protein